MHEEAQNKRGTNVLRTLSSDLAQLAELRAKLGAKPSKYAGLSSLVMKQEAGEILKEMAEDQE